MIDDAANLVRETVAEGDSVLFVGTKRQAQDTIAREAARAHQPYVNERWLGGTLTNWQTIRQRIRYLDDLERRRDAGEFDLLKKKERLSLEREIEKLNSRLGGIRNMDKLPGLLFVVDVQNEETAVREANKLKIPVIAMVDTNCDPDMIDFIIPANDDAIRAIKLITSKIADAALEGINLRHETLLEEAAEFGEYGADYSDYEDMDDRADEDLLGDSTLAKIREAEAVEEAASEAASEAVSEIAVNTDAEVDEEEADAEDVAEEEKEEDVDQEPDDDSDEGDENADETEDNE